MIVRQFLHTTPAIAVSYLFGCGSKRACCVVDPVYVPSFYLDAAESLAMQLRYVIDTHAHADHDSTGPALAAAANVPYVMHASTDAAFPFEPVTDGDRLELGNTVVDVLHLPGHTPEHLGLLVTDRTRSADPWFVVTGHTLMVGDMGRTELASSAREGALVFQSGQRLKSLADYVEVLPGAFAGSVCGRGLSGKTTTTIGFERRHNKALSIDDQQAFLDLMPRDIPPRPPPRRRRRARNLGKGL